MKKIYYSFVLMTIFNGLMFGQGEQLPNANFNDWSGEKFDGKIQPKSWNYSNVTQVGMKFNFANQVPGRSVTVNDNVINDYAMMVQDQELGVQALNLTETSPGYIALGHPWAYLEGINVNSATAGTYGGIDWKSRPDTLSVWVKRTGSHWKDEDFHVLFYAWKGTAKGNSYKSKNGGCTEIERIDEESDIRIALDENECGTIKNGTQICEGWVYDRKEYTKWVNLRIPIYYLNNEMPEKANVIFSASNYPNYRANDGLYTGNSLYVDDAELIYSSRIEQLIIGDKVWAEFNPNSSEEQVYELSTSATSIPTIVAKRGIGSLTNRHGKTVQFPGRELSGSELTIVKGAIGEVTTLTVQSEDKKSQTVYKIRFRYPASKNTNLSGIAVNGQAIAGFKSNIYEYSYALPYGTTQAPVVTCTKLEDKQQVDIVQADAVTGTATIRVTAEDNITKATYTIHFSVAQLSDNTLQDILVNGQSIAGFTPTRTTYKVSLPVDTKQMPTVQAVSAYAEGMQTIVYTAPEVINGGVYTIAVTSPGNPQPNTYKLTFKLEPSSYPYLKDLRMGDGENLITDFAPEKLNYSVSLPLGTLTLPTITPVPGDAYQKVEVQLGGLNGVSKVSVTAGDGVTNAVYKITVSTEVSSETSLQAIYVGGVALPNFNKDLFEYDYDLAMGVTSVPEVTVDKGDPYQVVTITYGGVNGTTRILVTAGDGSTQLYQIRFHQQMSSVNTLKDIKVAGVSLQGFDPEVTEYTYTLAAGTEILPSVTYTVGDEFQTITTRSGGVGGDYKIIVYPQQGASRTYTIHFVVETSSNTQLAMINLDGQPLEGFDPNQLDYDITLPDGVSVIPSVTVEKAESSQRVLTLLQGNQVLVTVTAQNGSKATYTLNFIIHISANAFLKAIFLNGDTIEGFAPDKLSYEVQYDDVRPVLTVEPDKGQQITIVLPQESGEARIIVRSQAGDVNTYRVSFIKQEQNDAVLKNIFVNGEPLEGFQSATFAYTIVNEGPRPTITWEAEETLQVTAYEQANVQLIRVVSATSTNVYVITLEQELSSDGELSAILIDGEALSAFNPTIREYTIDLEAGSELPQVTFVPKNERQQLVYGAVAPEVSSVIVTAEDGSTQVTYTVTFRKALYDLTAPISIEVTGHEINYQSETYIYNLSIGAGEELPQVVVVPDKGQSVAVYDENKSLQKVMVTAQDGSQSTYEIHYNRTYSSEAGLVDIIVDNESLEGFRPDQFDYVDSLPWRTKVIPCVMPKGKMVTQTITTHYCAVDGTMIIDVLAEDGVTKQTYTIAFPVIKSSNTNLAAIAFTNLSSLDFDPAETEYTILLPYGTTVVPQLEFYEKEEPEQRVAIESRPLGDTTIVTVTAEDGSGKTYRFLFKAKESESTNTLLSVQYRFARENTPDRFDTASLSVTQFETTVDLPYGTNAFEVLYEKNYNEQVVFAQQGGLLHPTILKVMANHADYEDLTYTITPKVSTQNPAVLTGITVDGTPIESFEPNTLTYVVNRTNINVPNVVYTHAASVICEPTTDIHTWKCVVTSDSYNNQYTIYFHYPNDIIPNGEFTEWTNAATRTSAKKPTGWQVAADYADTYLGTAKTGEEISQSGDAVKFTTTYWAALKSAIPSIITLGKLNFSFAVDKATSSQFYDQIPFRNSPDSVIFRYYLKEKGSEGEGALFAFRFFDNASQEYNFDYHNTQTSSNYQEIHHPLNTNGIAVQGMNIAVNATNQTTYASPKYFWSSGAEMYLDYIRFSYNSQLAALQVNGLDASLEGSAFKVALTDCEQTRIPTLTFTGQVSDQAQLVTWSNENAQGVRTATIRNYAEDGTYTDYTLEVTRPLQSRADLESVLVNGNPIAGFSASNLDYTYTMSSHQLPDISFVAISDLQTISMSYQDSVMRIVVKAENGTQKTYSVKVVRPMSNNTKLMAIDGLNHFDADTRTYTIMSDQLPDLNFTKAEDAQTVVMKDGVFTITAQDGTKGIYTILAQPQPRESQGVITEFELDGVIPTDFGGTNVNKTTILPDWVRFTLEDDRDSVVMIQTENHIQWQVYGAKANKTYTLSALAEEEANTGLRAILVADTLLEGFRADIKDYTLVTNTHIELRAIPLYAGQQVVVSRASNKYSIEVTSTDGLHTATYTVTIQPELSAVAALEMIYVDGQELTGFRSDSTDYTIILPAPQVKKEELMMPVITYRVAQGATAEVEAGSLSEQTLISVTSEDQMTHRYYTVTVEAEPSHNADLSAILVQNQPLEHFSPAYPYYSTKVKDKNFPIAWAMEDCFVEVTRTDVVSEDNVLVMLDTKAQDGITTRHYEVNVYVESFAANATLSDITLNGQPMSEFLSELNPMLTFSPMNNQYTINLPVGTTTLPDVQVVLGQEGQQVTYTQEGLQVQLQVTSKDKTASNVYTLQYVIPKSSNTSLSAIFVNGEPIADFEPTTYVYTCTLPLEDREQQPEVVGQQSETSQMVADAIFEGARATIEVTAEDQSKAQYIVFFDYQPSKVDTLKAIYQDAECLPGFVPTTMEYNITLPLNNRRFPNLDWEAGDKYQTVVMDTVLNDSYHLNRRITVTAQDGRQRVYRVNYEITKSQVDTLMGIFINDRVLEDFQSSKEEYVVYVEQGSEQPNITWAVGDEYQQVSVTFIPEVTGVKALKKAIILVEAESGAVRVYTIHFFLRLNNDTRLAGIALDGVAIDDFDPDTYLYRYWLDKGQNFPYVTCEKMYDEQQVQINQVQDTTILSITAEDGSKGSYRIQYQHKLSANSQLKDILLDNQSLTGFADTIYAYSFIIAYGETMPQIVPVAAEPEQVITLHQDTAFIQDLMSVRVSISVQAEDPDFEDVYVLSFSFALNDDATLQRIAVNNQPLADFQSTQEDYVICFPIGADSASFYALSDISYVLSDSLASATMEQQLDGVITIIVTAADGQTRKVYTLTQTITLDDNNYLNAIWLDGIELPHFDPEQEGYTYYLHSGDVVPAIEAIAESERATVHVNKKTVGDTTIILCEAENKEVRKYSIYFVYSDINSAQQPTSHDVLVKRIPGTTDVMVATIRKNVTFCLYDAYGHCMNMYKLPVANYNFSDIRADKDGFDTFFDFDVSVVGQTIHLRPNQVYLYAFMVTEGEKRILQSGKLFVH